MSHLVLVGLMATGKTTVGRILSEALDRPLLDSDAQIEARTGRTVREIWRTDGEARFRELEAEALAEALDREEPVVVAAAGGVVLSDVNRERLSRSDSHVVWLRARTETLLARLQATDDLHRPLLDEDPAGTLQRMFDHRSSLYLAVADRIVDVDGAVPEEVATEILDGVADEIAGARR